MSQPVGIRLTNCSRTFNQHIALHPLSLEIIPVEPLGLLALPDVARPRLCGLSVDWNSAMLVVKSGLVIVMSRMSPSKSVMWVWCFRITHCFLI